MQASGTNWRRELLAGLTTFSTMAYILFLNPQILSKTGMDFGAVLVATALTSAFANLAMGSIANYPFALAPSMGLNAYFAYGIVLGAGHPWQVALGACFLAGLFFFLLTVLGIREKLMHLLPTALRSATTAGIGLFLAFIGLKNVGIISTHEATLVTLGKMGSEALLTGLGVVVLATLLSLQVKGAMLLTILMNWALGLIFGFATWKGLFALPPSLAPTFLQLDLWNAFRPEYLSVVLSLTFVALFDTAGTLLGLAEQGGFLSAKGRLPRANQTLVNDSLGTMVGSLLGTSPLTTYLESAAGISVGGKTGLTTLVVALLFFCSLFISPLAASIPAFATAPVLIVLGGFLTRSLSRINWEDPADFIPAFVVFVSIPFTFSIATGIALGFILYPLVRLFSGRAAEVHPLVWLIALAFSLHFAMG